MHHSFVKSAMHKFKELYLLEIWIKTIKLLGPVPWQLIVRERLHNTLCPSRWIDDPTAGTKEKLFKYPR